MRGKILSTCMGFAVLFVAVPCFAANKFENAEYFQGTSNGQKKSVPAIKGSLLFDSEKKNVEFLDNNGTPASSIGYDSIKTIIYEKTSTPRYAAAVLVSPMFLLSHAKKTLSNLSIHRSRWKRAVHDCSFGQEKCAQRGSSGRSRNRQEGGVG